MPDQADHTHARPGVVVLSPATPALPGAYPQPMGRVSSKRGNGSGV